MFMDLFRKLRNFVLRRSNRTLMIGLSGVALAFVGGCILFMSSIPWLGMADTSLHLDYTWQVAQGQLPDFWEGAQAPIGYPQPRVHFVAQHPPLYYALLAPFTAPLIDHGHWKLATLLGGLLTMLMGLACVASFAWAGWVYGKKRRKLFALAVPAVLAPMTPFVIVSATIFNDTPALLLSSLAITCIALIIRRGVSWRDVGLLSIIATLGMASRAAFIGTVIIIYLAVFAALWLNGKESLAAKVRLAMLYNLAITALIILGTGWFYYRNFRISGNFTEVAPSDWPHTVMGRPYKSLDYVLRWKSLWLFIPRGLYGWPNPTGALTNSSLFSYVVFFGSFIGGLVVALRDRAFGRLSRKDIVTYGLLALLAGMMFGQQIMHAVGYGALNARYIMPVWVPLGLVIAYAALAPRRARGLVVAAIVAGGWLSLFAAINYLLVSRWNVLSMGKNGLAFMQQIATVRNGLPAFVVPVAVMFIGAGVVLQVYSLYKLHKDKAYA